MHTSPLLLPSPLAPLPSPLPFLNFLLFLLASLLLSPLPSPSLYLSTPPFDILFLVVLFIVCAHFSPSLPSLSPICFLSLFFFYSPSSPLPSPTSPSPFSSPPTPLSGAYPGGVLRVLKHPPEAQSLSFSEYSVKMLKVSAPD